MLGGRRNGRLSCATATYPRAVNQTQEWQTRLERLVEKGHKLPFHLNHNSTYYDDDPLTPAGELSIRTRDGYYDYGPARGWGTQARIAMVALLGEDHDYVKQFTECFLGYLEQSDVYQGNPTKELVAAIAIVEAVLEDIRHGDILHTVEGLAQANIFTDFLEMAEHLLDEDYKDPAASLTGAVLEDGLRKIVVRRGKPEQKNLQALNDMCRDARIYNTQWWLQVKNWTKLRDSADHGYFDSYDASQVRQMISGVRQFLTQYHSP